MAGLYFCQVCHDEFQCLEFLQLSIVWENLKGWISTEIDYSDVVLATFATSVLKS